MPGFLYWIAAASAATLDPAVPQALLDDVVPWVEARTDRRFVNVPKAAMASRDELYPALLRPSGLSALLDPGDRLPSPTHRRIVSDLLDRAIAVYVAQHEQIFVVEEVLDEVSRTFGLDDEVVVPLVQCVLSHELVHALQHQYAVEASVSASRGQRALREGHASLVAGDYCAEVHGAATLRLMETVQNIELDASLEPDDEPAVYAWGRRLAATLEAEGLLWPALRASPPPWSDVVAAVTPTLPPAWRVGDPLVQAVTAVGVSGRAVHASGAVSPTSILGPFLGRRGGRDAMPEASGGFSAQAADASGELMVLAFLLEERGAAARLVAERRARAEDADTPWVAYGTGNATLARPPRVRRLGGLALEAEDAAKIVARTRDGRRATEAWVALPRRLFVLLDAGHRLSRRELARAMETLERELDARPGAELGLGPLQGWMAEVRAIDPEVTRRPGWSYRLHEAVQGLLAGDDDACRSVFVPHLEPGAPDRRGHARAAFECAAVRWDLELALRALPLVDEVPAMPAVRLAAHALDDDAPRVASRILAKTAPDPAHELPLAALRVATAVKLGRWTEVESMVRRTPMLPAGVRAWAGSAMVRAGRAIPGRRILGAACPELIGEERTRCEAAAVP